VTSKVKGRVECRKFLHDTAPHYGLRYGPVPATGNFQRLRGPPPLVSPLKSCMRRSFTAVTPLQILLRTDPLSKRFTVFRRSQQLRERRDTVKTEATAAEKDWQRNYPKASNGCRYALIL
jgi:hypothetical protein